MLFLGVIIKIKVNKIINLNEFITIGFNTNIRYREHFHTASLQYNRNNLNTNSYFHSRNPEYTYSAHLPYPER